MQEKDQLNDMSEVCKVAHHIYRLWKDKGNDELLKYFIEIGIPISTATLLAKKYAPENCPAQACPIDGMNVRKISSHVFGKLALQIETADKSIWPKNLLGWWIMRYVFGEEVFNFQIMGTSSQQKNNQILFPALPCNEKGEPIPFGIAALELESVGDLPMHILRKANLLSAELGKTLGISVAKMLLQANIIFPPPKEIHQLSRMITRGLNGEEVIITGAFCPDYSYRRTGDPIIPFEYTFEGVSGGVGLVAQQFQRVVPHIHELLNTNHIKHRFMFSIGDFEANSQVILDRVGLTKEIFLCQCQSSLKAFQESMPNIPMQLYLFQQEVANGRWTKYAQEAYQAMQSGDFGSIKINTGKDPVSEVVRFVANSGRNFYNSWYGKEHTLDELMQLVIAQGSEYAAMGRIIAEDFSGQPVIQIAGDRPKMQAFNAMYSDHPTFCAKRVY